MVGDVKGAVALADTVASVPAAAVYCLETFAIAGDQVRFERAARLFAAAPPLWLRRIHRAPFEALVRGVLLLRRGKAVEALESLRSAALYENASGYGMQPQYWRGYALLAVKRPADAAAEFRKVISLRSLSAFAMTWPLAHVGLARAYAAAGDTAASRKAYEDFFALWKEADRDVPILVEARKEYAALK